MQDLTRIRFIATNYINLQGMRNLPIGACLLGVTLYVNQLHHALQGWDYGLLFVIVLLSASLFFFIDRYYLANYGHVQRTPQSRKLEWLVSSILAILALAAFWMDVKNIFQISMIGIICAVGILTEYFRLSWFTKEKLMIYYPIGAVILIIISLLPVLGLPNWWVTFGFKSQLLAISAILGICTLVASLIGHFVLMQLLSSMEESHANAI